MSLCTTTSSIVLSICILYIGSGTVKKVVEINKYLLGTVAGGAGKDFCDL